MLDEYEHLGADHLYANQNDTVVLELYGRIAVGKADIQVAECRTGLAEVESVHLSVEIENCIVSPIGRELENVRAGPSCKNVVACAAVDAVRRIVAADDIFIIA